TELSVITDSGELRTFRLTPATSVHLLEHDVSQEVGRYLSLIASTRAADVRKMAISTEGNGERELMVSYISEVPVWKSTYRIVLSSDAKQKPLLQGWAVVDNTVGEDWDNVELALIAGAPQSFIENISQPYYARRPEISLPTTAMLSPQTHDAALLQPPGAGLTPYEQMGLAGKADRLTDSNERLQTYTRNGLPEIKSSAQSVTVEATGGPVHGSGFGASIFKPSSSM